ncbi:MAG: hypothetical protein QOH49_1621 [Acidobacteriota bacterium]|jgi:hypothetical protein|nr:hypothetical protein [Acidobacteriota bacterium]
MADLEVENTLREIRERVLADSQRRAPVAATTTNGTEVVVANGHAGPAGEVLARMDANLATTGRAWSRLPPLLSYRRGAAARFEIWVKQLVKRAAHWFTWEQVNFNAAVHHALGDARSALAAQEQALAAHDKALARVQNEILTALRAEAEADRARVAELKAQVAEAQARFESGGAQLRQAFTAGLERLAESQRASTAALRKELREEQGTRAESLHAATNARAAELHAEMRERVDGLLEEQRVCFKQLSLEAGEAAVTHDRARRQLEARLEAVEKAVNREP